MAPGAGQPAPADGQPSVEFLQHLRGPVERSRRLGRIWAYLLDDLRMRDPSCRRAPSLALYRHAYATEKRESAS